METIKTPLLLLLLLRLLLAWLAGWTALAGMTALVVLLLTVATWVVRQYTSPSKDGYSLVQKKAPLSFV
jgi:hypothetical protein